MAFILRLIDAPEVATPQAAERFIAGQRGRPAAANPKFSAFKQAITATYPDLSEDDLDGDDDENVWEEGLGDEASYGNVKDIALKEELTDTTLVKAIADAAIRGGLHVYDDEGQVLYHASGKAIRMNGRSEPF